MVHNIVRALSMAFFMIGTVVGSVYKKWDIGTFFIAAAIYMWI